MIAITTNNSTNVNAFGSAAERTLPLDSRAIPQFPRFLITKPSTYGRKNVTRPPTGASGLLAG
jgi:hypothetical protein